MPLDDDAALTVSCAFPSVAATPDHIALAEQLGYTRAWCYDSPAVYGDVWMTLALAASRTTRIGLGPAVLVPSLRHPLATAAAIAHLHELAPGRVAAAVGTGFTGRFAMGQPRLKWADVAAYVRTVKELLAGRRPEWEGAAIQLLHRDPIEVPLLIAADGPRGRAVAAELGDGVFVSSPPADPEPSLPDWRAQMTFGTVLDQGESLDSARVFDAAGPAVAVTYHGLLEDSNSAMLDVFPGGAQWRAEIESIPEAVRHLALHEGHLTHVTERDTAVVKEGVSLLPTISWTGSAAELGERAQAARAQGITEIVYQPAGSDIPGELTRFLQALQA